LGKALLAPTRIYVKPMLEAFKTGNVHAAAHITGGGLLENIPRVLPDNCCAVINTASWDEPPLFTWLMAQGNVERNEMYRTFNCGVGMVVCVDAAHVDELIELFQRHNESAWLLGQIETVEPGAEQVRMVSA